MGALIEAFVIGVHLTLGRPEQKQLDISTGIWTNRW